MKLLYFGFLVLFFNIIPAANAKNFSSSKGYYDNKADGFFLGHFDSIGELRGCRNFDSTLYRGGRPELDSRAWLDRFLNEKIDYVIDLRSEANQRAEDTIVNAGLGYIHLPLYTGGTTQPTPSELKIHFPGEDVQIIKKDIVDLTIDLLNLTDQLSQDGHKIYIHCARGEDRSGIFIALLRKCAAWNPEFRRYGGVEYDPLKWLRLRVQARSNEY